MGTRKEGEEKTRAYKPEGMVESLLARERDRERLGRAKTEEMEKEQIY